MNIKNIKLVGIILAVVAALAVLDILGLCDGRGNTQILLFKKPVAGIRKGDITHVHKPIFSRCPVHFAAGSGDSGSLGHRLCPQTQEKVRRQMKTKKLYPLYLNGAVYTGDGKSLPKHYRCKSRKRYIKLLMGGGIGRDQAKALAEIDLVWHGSYKRAWEARCINRENPGVHVF